MLNTVESYPKLHRLGVFPLEEVFGLMNVRNFL